MMKLKLWKETHEEMHENENNSDLNFFFNSKKKSKKIM
jgi:hypothetical protein